MAVVSGHPSNPHARPVHWRRWVLFAKTDERSRTERKSARAQGQKLGLVGHVYGNPAGWLKNERLD
jgi:hypothetical protein